MKGLYQKNSKEAVLARKDPQFRHGRYCTFHLKVYLVFVTKYRGFCFSEKVLTHIKEVMNQVCLSYDAQLVQFSGEGDYVRLTVCYPPKISISKLVNSLKTVSSRYIKKKNYSEVQKKLWGTKLWATSYFVGPCSQEGLHMVNDFIKNQE